MFGNYNGTFTSDTGDDTKYTRGVGFADYGRFTKYSEEAGDNEINVFFRKAGSGDIPSLTSYVPASVGEAWPLNDDRTSSDGLWAGLNIKLRGYKKGCDTLTGRIIGEDVIF